MIPATQRPDGSWRKARRIRQGFNTNSGGAPRYVPPPYRNTSDIGECGEVTHDIGGQKTRSLTEVASSRQGVGRAELPAALFLRTMSAKFTTLSLRPSSDREYRRSTSAERVIPTSTVMACARSAMSAAQEQLGCDGCRPLSPEISAENSNTNATFQHLGANDGTRNWWARLRKVERGSIGASTVREEGLWFGIELSLRWSDVDCTDGQAAIFNFMRSLVVLDEEEGEEKEDDGSTATAGLQRDTAKLDEGKGRAFAWHGEEERHAKETHKEAAAWDNDGDVRDTVGGRRRKDVGGFKEKYMMESDPAEAEATTGVDDVAAVILLFGGELSKRDRAELHSQAETAAGIASSSHGVGDSRFLALRCDRGGISSTPAGAELDLSREQAELALRLFRLAQQEYHSRYERLSHREIREIVSLGGPHAEDHPDLFRLLERIDVDDTPKRPYRY